MPDIFYTDEFEDWFHRLGMIEKEDLDFVVELLGEVGLCLSYPHSSAIKNSRYPLRELRPKHGQSPLRVIYVFDPRRDAVLLIGGDKGKDQRLYKRLIPFAERIFDKYLEEQRLGLHDREDSR